MSARRQQVTRGPILIPGGIRPDLIQFHQVDFETGTKAGTNWFSLKSASGFGVSMCPCFLRVVEPPNEMQAG
jgi:hypothetical protein